MAIQIIGIKGIPIVKPGDAIAHFICDAAYRQGIPIEDGDIIVVTHKIVSKSEERIVWIKDVAPSSKAKALAKKLGKIPSITEMILRESRSIVRAGGGHLITETRQGWVCANSGVDISNVAKGKAVALLPADPDKSARRLRIEIKKILGKNVAVIISDTFGRPLREGQVNVAIGIAGIKPIYDWRGEKDLFGYTFRVKQIAIADELASAAELVLGQAAEGIPAAIIKGYKFRASENARATELIRPREEDLFI